MEKLIYENRAQAEEASRHFGKMLEALENEFGATFWENDDCAGSGYCFRYYGTDGKVETLY